MARSVEKIIFGLKLRTKSKENVLTLRIGVKKYVLPFEARLIKSDEYIFVHVPPSAELMKITRKGLEVVTRGDEAEKAVVSFKRSRRKTKRPRKAVVMNPDLESALKKVPSGYRLGYGADGKPRLIKTRKRKRKAAPAKAKRRKTAAKKRKPAAKRRKK